jgi:hypothetical protein
MNIEKSVVLSLNNKEVGLLKQILNMCSADLNDRFKNQRPLWDLSFSEMQEMASFAHSLESL